MDNVLTLDEALAGGWESLMFGAMIRVGMTINFRKCWLEVVDEELRSRNEWRPVVLTSEAEVGRFREWLELGAAVEAGK